MVDAIGRDHPVAPLRLATVYLDDENVRALIGAQEEAFAAALDRIRGRHEWGVKAFAAARPDPEPSDDDSALGPGAAYLPRRRAARERASRAGGRCRRPPRACTRGSPPPSSASRRYPPQDPSLSGHQEEMVLNAAYLVEVGGSTAAFTALVDAWRSPLIEVALTGPWPPYSFAALEEP